MVNVGWNTASLMGFVQILVAIAYPFIIIPLMVIKPAKPAASRTDIGVAIALVQSVLVSLTFLLTGLILFFNGWRLDPILQVAYVLMFALVLLLMLKEVLLRLLQE
ncbi:MAG: Ycf66 family protein [Cyanobacteria bacterium P01_G01_bin.54]